MGRRSALTAAIFSMISSGVTDEDMRACGISTPRRNRKSREETNKYGLSTEEKILLEGMSPKEKKIFLKARNG